MAIPDPYQAQKKQTTNSVPNTNVPKPPDLSDYTGAFATMADAQKAINDGTFASAPTTRVPAPPSATTSTAPPAAAPAVVPNTSAPTQYTDWQAKQNQLMNQYEAMINTPFQYNPATDPKYTAFRDLTKSRADAAAQDAMRATEEEMNNRGLLNSSLTTSQLGQIQNKAKQSAETEALAQVPAFENQARSDYQNRLQNAASLLTFAAGRGDTAYRQNRDAIGDAQKAEQTAYDRAQAADKTAYDRGQDAFKNQQDLAKQHIDLANYLSEKYGVPVYPTDDPMESYAQVAGIPTLAAKKIAADAEQQGFENAIKQALAENTINTSQANIALQAQQQAETAGYHQQSLAISKQNADLAQSKQQEGQKAKDYESQVLSGLAEFDNPTEALGWLQANSGDIAKNLGADAYDKLVKSLPTYYGVEKDTSAKDAAALRKQAISLAQGDAVAWNKAKTPEQKQALIDQYVNLLQGK